eukprot:TRINITY_DN241_c0_g1_i6.p2 TRINITY_DN241_c0_g1~~TRINITY_DN241_c0_g1_i6.p2  ORF type:complete len:188 (+),score=81.08 TRINITY_DN241_c0_g1_i6:70-633(+)
MCIRDSYCVIDKKTYKVTKDAVENSFTVEAVGHQSEKTTVDKNVVESFKMYGDSLIKVALKCKDSGEVTDKTVQFVDVKDGNKYNFYYRGSDVQLSVYNEDQFALKDYMPVIKARDMSKIMVSPMPGAVVSVNVKPGDHVVDGQELLVIEAMKMQNIIRAEKEAKVKGVKVKKGQSVAVDETLIEFE